MKSFLTVDYDEVNASSYKGLILSLDNGQKIQFNTGDPLIDWYDFGRFMYGGKAHELGIESCGCSSNVDHWFMDGDQFVEKYFDPETHDFIPAETLDRTPMHEWNEKWIKCVIRKDMINFKQLKEYYLQNKK